MKEQRVTNFKDLLDRLDALTEAAEAGPIDPVIVDYLKTTRQRVALLPQRMAEGRRLSPRHASDGEARLVVRDRTLPVRIQDRSETGFGLLAEEPVEAESYARLDIDGQQEGEIYEGLVVHCEAEGGSYRIGLDVVSSLRIG